MRILRKKHKEDQSNRRPRVIMMIALLVIPVVFFFLGYASHPAWDLETTIQDIKKVLIKSDQAIMQDIRQEMGLYTSNGLATLFIDIPFDSLIRIEEKRTNALAAGILLTSDDDFVPATMHLNDGDSFSVKIRLKGDWTDHLVGDKWSFRIHITDPDAAVLGMRRFSIQAPETRNYEKEWVYHQNLIQEEILTPRYYFINIVQNGKFNGIYALEESFSEDLLESQSRREGPIIRFNEDLLWKNWENLGTADTTVDQVVDEIGKFWLTDAGNSEITAFRQNHLTEDELLAGELFTAIELLYSFNQGDIPGEEVFDLDMWGKYFALTDLWGAGHATGWHNLRFYFNPVTGLLEPVVFDALPFEPSTNRERLAFPFGEQGFIQKIFRLPAVQKSYATHLERVTTTTYLDELESRYGQQLDHFHSVLRGYLEKGVFGDIPPLPWDDLRVRAHILSNNLASPQPIQGTYQVIQLNGRDHLQLKLKNLMVLPVELSMIVIGDSRLAIDPDWCQDFSCKSNLIPEDSKTILVHDSSITMHIPLSSINEELTEDTTISVSAAVWGGSTQTDNPLTDNYSPEGGAESARPRSGLDNTLTNHSFLELKSDGSLEIIPGDWSVEGDLILPDHTDLSILQGTTLSFDEGAVFVIDGGVNFSGTAEEPILFTSQAESWAGMVIYGDGTTKSTWKHVKVERTSGIIRGGWVLTGAVTFYENNPYLEDTEFSNNTAEDALNIIRADFEFSRVEFYNTTSDAFDGDFTTGLIDDCKLEDIGGDGLDFSGSTVTITNTEFYNIGDKAVSAGENTNLSISDSFIQSTNIGIASKDLSKVIATTITIENADVAGLAAYVKKPQYGPASLNASDIEMANTETPGLCQTGSLLTLNSDQISCQDIDVESLYDQGILGN